jgi:hypothetical protein
MHGKSIESVRNFLKTIFFPDGVCDKSLLPVFMQNFHHECKKDMGMLCEKEEDLRSFIDTIAATGGTHFNNALDYTIKTARGFVKGRGLQVTVYTDAQVAGDTHHDLPGLLSGVDLRLVVVGSSNFPEAEKYCSYNPQSSFISVGSNFFNDYAEMSRLTAFVGKPSVAVPSDAWLCCLKTGHKLPAKLKFEAGNAFVWGILPTNFAPDTISFTLSGLEAPHVLPLIVKQSPGPQSTTSINTAFVMAELKRSDLTDEAKIEMAIRAKLVVPNLTGYICKVAETTSPADPIHATGDDGDCGTGPRYRSLCGAEDDDDDTCHASPFSSAIDDNRDGSYYAFRSFSAVDDDDTSTKRAKTETKEWKTILFKMIENWLNNNMDANREFLFSHPFFRPMSSLRSNTAVMIVILQFVEKYQDSLQLQESELDSFKAAKKKMYDIKSFVSSSSAAV